MMISKKIRIILLSTLMMPFSATTALASEVTGNAKDTPISIEIVESPIRLNKVIAPTFGTYYDSAEKQVLKATGDLIIGIVDYREMKDTPWSLSYEISTFSNGNEYSVKMNLGKGIATSKSGQPLSGNSMVFSKNSNESGKILEAYSTNEEEFSYRVEKENITLEIPGSMPTGDFSGKQLVTLINTPSVN